MSWNQWKARIKRSWTRWRNAGSRHSCTVCGFQASRFLPSGLYVRRTDAKCPACSSLERHRHMALILDGMLAENSTLKTLHFAPEPCFSQYFARHPGVAYRTSHYDPQVSADFHLDLLRIDQPDACFDLVICSHVLEHVPDDGTALSEIRRILRPGGTALLQVPHWPSEAHPTYENPAIEDPRDRIIHFGQFDHLRIYGLEFADKIRSLGFTVEVLDMAEQKGPTESSRLGLANSTGIRELTYVCRKP